MEQALIGINEVSREIGVSIETIKDWAERGILTLSKVGRSLYVDEESLANVKEEALKLGRQMRGVEQLRMELEASAKACMDEIKKYKQERMFRKESGQRVNLYMEIFASLTDVIYDGKYDEREYKAVTLFLKGHGIKDIAEELGVSTTTVLCDIRKCNEILFNLQPYTKMSEKCRENQRKAELLEKKVQILRTMLGVCRKETVVGLGNFDEDDVIVLMTPVDRLNLSAKTKKALANGRVKYVGDMVFYGEERLMNISGFGPSSLQEVKVWLAKANLPLGMRQLAWDCMKKAYGEQEPFIYEKLFDLDAETNDFLEKVLEDLPEDRAGEIRELFLGLFAMGEKYKENFCKYKQINKALREEITRIEKDLKNENYYLSPVYEEVKKFFGRVEHLKERKGKEDAVTPAETALGFLDCIFSQEVLRAESRRMEENVQAMVTLEKKVKKLEAQLSDKAYMAQMKAEQIELAREKRIAGNVQPEEVYKEKAKALAKELSEMRSLNEKLAKKADRTEDKELIKKLSRECREAKKQLEIKDDEIKQLKFDKKARDLTIETLSRVQRETGAGSSILADITQKQKMATDLEMAEEKLRMSRMDMRKLELELDAQRASADNLKLELDAQKTSADKLKLELDAQRTSADKALKRELQSKEREYGYAMSHLEEKLQEEIGKLWGALSLYECQVNEFNDLSFFGKMKKRLEKFSDGKTKTLTHQPKAGKK